MTCKPQICILQELTWWFIWHVCHRLILARVDVLYNKVWNISRWLHMSYVLHTHLSHIRPLKEGLYFCKLIVHVGSLGLLTTDWALQRSACYIINIYVIKHGTFHFDLMSDVKGLEMASHIFESQQISIKRACISINHSRFTWPVGHRLSPSVIDM